MDNDVELAVAPRVYLPLSLWVKGYYPQLPWQEPAQFAQGCPEPSRRLAQGHERGVALVNIELPQGEDGRGHGRDAGDAEDEKATAHQHTPVVAQVNFVVDVGCSHGISDLKLQI